MNALLGDKYSEVSMKRTTAGINQFQVVNTTNHSSTTPPSLSPSSADEIHATIAKDNETLRTQSQVEEKTFGIHLEQPIIIGDVRPDTRLTLIDIPGMNEADSSKKYKDYVASKWNTFDAVVVVMDAIQGVNTQEQVDLLQFVKENNEHLKRVPTVILCNKMDNPTDANTITLVEEARDKAIEIFGDGCKKEFLERLLESAKENGGGGGGGRKMRGEEHNHGPVFLPVSAKNAFMYRKLGNLTVETFEETDQDLLNVLGKDEVGRKWDKMTLPEKVNVIRDVVNDPEQYKERLAETNFDNFLSILSYFIGDGDAQKKLLASQVDVALKLLPTAIEAAGSISDCIHEVFKKCESIGRPTDDLTGHFWNHYERCESTNINAVKKTVNPAPLAQSFLELEKYHDLAGLLQWPSEQSKAKARMNKLYSQQISLVVDKEKSWSLDKFLDAVRTTPRNKKSNKKQRLVGAEWKAPNHVTWDNLSPMDWENVLSSILLPMGEMEVYKDFGIEKSKLEKVLLYYRMKFDVEIVSDEELFDVESFTSSSVSFYLGSINTMESNQDAHDAIAKVATPASIADPKHFGFIGWKLTMFNRRHCCL